MTWCSTAAEERWLVKRVFTALLASAVLAFLLVLPVPRDDGHLISSDGAFYYSYLRSLVMDGDIDISNDIDLYNSRMPETSPDRLGMGWAYAFPVGPALLNLPGFLLARGVVLAVHALGYDIATDGYSFVEEGAFCLGNVLMAVAGLYLLFLALRKHFSCTDALAAVLYVLFGGAAVAYLYLETWMSHAPELLGVGLVVHLLAGGRSEGRQWLYAGAALGLAFLLRWQNVLYVALFVTVLSRREMLRAGPIIGSGLLFLFVAFPQLLFWKLSSGSWLLIPQGEDFIGIQHMHLFEVLFSTRHGLFLWTPLAGLSLAGLMLLKDPRLRYGLIMVFLLQLAVVAFNAQWWAGNSFGMRRLIGVTPVFAFGLAGLLDRMQRKRVVVHALAWCCTVWTTAFFVQYALHLIPRDGYLDWYHLLGQKLALPVLLFDKLRSVL